MDSDDSEGLCSVMCGVVCVGVGEGVMDVTGRDVWAVGVLVGTSLGLKLGCCCTGVRVCEVGWDVGCRYGVRVGVAGM